MHNSQIKFRGIKLNLSTAFQSKSLAQDNLTAFSSLRCLPPLPQKKF